jgi:hypothetical protein
MYVKKKNSHNKIISQKWHCCRSGEPQQRSSSTVKKDRSFGSSCRYKMGCGGSKSDTETAVEEIQVGFSQVYAFCIAICTLLHISPSMAALLHVRLPQFSISYKPTLLYCCYSVTRSGTVLHIQCKPLLFKLLVQICGTSVSSIVNYAMFFIKYVHI